MGLADVCSNCLPCSLLWPAAPAAAMKVGPGNWSPNDDKVDVGQKEWKLLTSGFNYAVWEAVF